MMMTLRRERPPAAAPRAPGRESEQSFDAAFVALLPTVRAFARRLAKSDADDIAQGAILRAWAAHSSYAPGTNLKAWLLTILHNHVYSEARRNGRTEAMAPEIIENILFTTTIPPHAGCWTRLCYCLKMSARSLCWLVREGSPIRKWRRGSHARCAR
jgi:RNA polymerase sigma factor (sigma-70 family)